jgi:hypothetical protein
MDHGGYAQHASGIDTRYIPFTTARRKKQRYRLTNRVGTREVTWCGTVKRATSNLIARASQRRDALVDETQKFKKHAMKQGFLSLRDGWANALGRRILQMICMANCAEFGFITRIVAAK